MIAYLDSEETGRYPYQAVEADDIEYVREPDPEEIKLYRKYRDDLIRREIKKYENEYRDAKGALETLRSNLRFYGLM